MLVAALGCCAVSASGQSQPEFRRKIAGNVVDKQDQAVAGARVCVWGTGPMAGRLSCGQTDVSGRFSIEVYRPDNYRIIANHEALGYPEASWAFYGKIFGEFPVVTVDETNIPKPVTVRVGPKAGRVIFTIFDNTTRKLIESGSITVCRADEPLSCWSKSTEFPNGRYELLTPEVPFTLRFQTWDGRAWVERTVLASESDDPLRRMMVELGARIELTLRLK